MSKFYFKFIMNVLFLLSGLAPNLHGQADKKIKIHLENGSLNDALFQISKQTYFNTSYDVDTLNPIKPITFKKKGITVQELLDKLITKPYHYIIDRNVIRISHDPLPDKTLNNNNSPSARKVDLSGIVLDKKKFLSEVTVRVEGQALITKTDKYGGFVLKGAPPEGVLKISIIGYYPLVFHYKPTSKLEFHLREKTDQLDIIEIGYQSTFSKLKTGSINTVKIATIAKPPVNDLTIAVQGRMPGVAITQSSGLPGAATKVLIRGQNSIANGTTPLYVVDGVPWNGNPLTQVANAAFNHSPFNSIRLEDIDFISVLKDADATAIYGSRGANCVILITTKRPLPGAPRIEFNAYESYGRVASRMKLMNTAQYLQMRREGLSNDKTIPGQFDVDMTWDANRYIDWQKELIGGTAHTKDRNATVTGGSEQTQYQLSFGDRSETTVFPGKNVDKTDFARVTILHQSEDKKLYFRFSSNYAHNVSDLPQTDIARYIYMAPNAPDPYNADGTLSSQYGNLINPMSALFQRSKINTSTSFASSTISYDFPYGIQLKANLGYNKTTLRDVTTTPLTSMPGAQETDSFLRSNSSGRNEITSYILEPQLKYNKTIKDHYLDALVGGSMQQSRQQRYLGKGFGFHSDSMIDNLANATFVDSDYNDDLYRYFSGFVRLGYNYKEKYVGNLTIRSDGNSKFALGNRFATFSSLGVAWLFSEEDWIKNHFSFLSLGKLRASIGSVGNDQLAENQSVNTYQVAPGTTGGGLLPATLANPLNRWETTRKMDVGISLEIKKTYFFDVTYYRNRSKNQLLRSALPDYSGFESKIENIPAVVENKGLEFLLKKNSTKSTGLRWESSLNMTFPKNRLLKFPGLASSAYADQLFIGYPLAVKPLYNYTGINSATGAATFEDRDKNGVIDNRDKIPVSVGLKYYGGWSNTFFYKGLMLDIFIQYVNQTSYYFVAVGTPGGMRSDGGNQRTEILNRWQTPGDVAPYQKFAANNSVMNSSTINLNQSTARIFDGSYARLKNVSLSWSLPDNLTKKLALQTLRMYVQGQNLFTITKLKESDPETQSFGNIPPTPLLRTLTIGVQVIFKSKASANKEKQ